MSNRLSNTKQDKGHLCFARGTELVATLMLSLSTPALAAESIKINDLVVAATIPEAQREATLKAVRVFYDFWNTGQPVPFIAMDLVRIENGRITDNCHSRTI